MSKPIVIIDGSSYIFRAFFAIQRLSNSAGFPTNAVYGVMNMLLKVTSDLSPETLVVVFDSGKPSFRKDMYPEYKANREAAPDDLVKQFPLIFEAADAMGMRQLTVEGVEADDVIATLVERARKDGRTVTVVTGDKDLMQLVGEDVQVYDTMKEVKYDPKAVEEKFQVRPDQIADYLALVGDASDNIPGVKGIGKKTAAELLGKFDTLDGIYRNLDQIPQKKRRETLEEHQETARLSRQLTELKRDVQIAESWKDFHYEGQDPKTLQDFLQKMEFKTLLERFGLETRVQGFEPAQSERVTTIASLKKVLDRLAKAPVVAVDTETSSLSPREADLVGISLCGDGEKAYYLPMGHFAVKDGERLEVADQLPRDEARELLKPFLENPKILKVGQNLKFDIQVFKQWGVDLKGVKGDTMIASYLVESDQPHNMDSLSKRHLNHDTISFEDVAGKGKNQVTFGEVPLDRATDYAAEDADVTLRLHGVLDPMVDEAELRGLYENVELPLIEVLAEMEFGGIRVDQRVLERMSEELQADLGEWEQKIFEMAGEPFNVNSPKQLSHILFEKLKLPVLRKTKTGVSTDERVLQKLSDKHEICGAILEYRGLQKLRSTYAEGLLSQISEQTGRIHAHFNQTVTATGRLSSSSPNLQNIPVPGETGYDVRAVFLPSEGCRLFAADYSQVELRLLADMSGDEVLLEAFSKDEDVHAYTARLIFGTKEVSEEQRKVAKTINFGVIYGQTPYGLSQTLGISTGEAKEFIDTYFARYPRVKNYLESLVETARETGYARTKLGRRRRVPELESRNRMRREMAERMATNTPLQGTAADMIKIAMVRLSDVLKKEGLKSRMVLQVHDELVLDVPKEESDVVEKHVKHCMETAMELKVPLKVDSGWGENWSQC